MNINKSINQFGFTALYSEYHKAHRNKNERAKFVNCRNVPIEDHFYNNNGEHTLVGAMSDSIHFINDAAKRPKRQVILNQDKQPDKIITVYEDHMGREKISTEIRIDFIKGEKYFVISCAQKTMDKVLPEKPCYPYVERTEFKFQQKDFDIIRNSNIPHIPEYADDLLETIKKEFPKGKELLKEVGMK